MKYKVLSFLFSCVCVFASPCLFAEEYGTMVNQIEEEEYTPRVNQTEEKRTGFFALDFSGSFIPSESLLFNSPGLGVLFGGQIIPQNIFSLGLRVNEDPAMSINYSYEFESINRKWVPGISVSSLIGFSYGGNRYKHEVELDGVLVADSDEKPTLKKGTPSLSSGPYLALGLDVGVYLRVFITKNIATLFKTSLSHRLVSVKDINLEKDDIYWNIGAGVRWYLL